MIEIPLTRGKVALIDDEDAHLAQFAWYAARGRHTWYARRVVPRDVGGKRRPLYLHREVLGIADLTTEVDHADGNGLDCRRKNLRAATAADNQRNARLPRTNTSGFRGVSRSGRKARPWVARIRDGASQRRLGCFATAEEAARAYDEAARRIHGSFASLNSPQHTNQTA